MCNISEIKIENCGFLDKDVAIYYLIVPTPSYTQFTENMKGNIYNITWNGYFILRLKNVARNILT